MVPSTTGLLAQANCSFCYQWYSLPEGLDCSAHREQYWLWAPTGNSLLPRSLHPPLSSLPISLNSNCSKIQWAFVCKVLSEPQLPSSHLYKYEDIVGFILHSSTKIIHIFVFIFLQKFRELLNCYALFFHLVSVLLWNGFLFLSPLVDVPMVKGSLSCALRHEGYLEGAICMPLLSDGVLQMEGGCSGGEEKWKAGSHCVFR